MTGIPVAFHAPLKSPNHPSPSGDRTMARLLLAALRLAGFEPDVASDERSHEPNGSHEVQHAIRRRCENEVDRLTRLYRAAGASAPRLWFTYHCYYKAPDFLGPAVAAALGIPYVIAEGSRAPKRAVGPWSEWHRAAESALDRANLLLAMTGRDRQELERGLKAGQRLLPLPPFLRLSDWPDGGPKSRIDGSPARLLAVAMMRDGDKLASYRLLAEALALVDTAGPARFASTNWRLDVVGDGHAREKVEAALGRFGSRVTFHGRVDGVLALAARYAASDLIVWPAVGEAYGMALLEAQACGRPVLAGNFGGVADVIENGRTGWLSPPGDASELARLLAELIGDPTRLDRAGREARGFVAKERDLPRAAATLRDSLGPLLTGSPR